MNVQIINTRLSNLENRIAELEKKVETIEIREKESK